MTFKLKEEKNFCSRILTITNHLFEVGMFATNTEEPEARQFITGNEAQQNCHWNTKNNSIYKNTNAFWIHLFR